MHNKRIQLIRFGLVNYGTSLLIYRRPMLLSLFDKICQRANDRQSIILSKSLLCEIANIEIKKRLNL